MTMTGLFHITLSPAANEDAFVEHMNTVVFKNAASMQLTRITRSIEHDLLKGRGPVPTYAWQVRVRLETDHEYDFAQNIPRVQEAVGAAGVLSGLDVYVNAGGEA